MNSKNIVYKINEKIPEEIRKNQSGFYCAWLDGKLNFFVEDCRNNREAKLLSTAKITVDVYQIEDILFFTIRIPALQATYDIPYNVVHTPLTIEEIREGISEMYLIFATQEGIIKTIRGMRLDTATRQHLATFFEKEFENCHYDITSYYQKVQTIFSQYGAGMLDENRRVMQIDWVRKEEIH